MATSQKKEPWFFNFLKEGLLLPSRNRRLFTAVCALILISNALVSLSNDLAVKPLADEIQLDLKALNTTEPEPGRPDVKKLLRVIQNDTKELLLVGGGHHLLTVVVRAAVRIVVLFAAVLTYSGEHEHPSTTSFRALLRHAKAQIEGPLLLTLAFGYVLGIAKFVLLAVMASLVGILMATQYHVALFVAALLLVAVYVGGEYLSFLCSFSVVVAVAEPRCHGAAPLGKAWRLVKGKKRQVALYLAITTALAYAVSPVRTLSRTYAGDSAALRFLLGFVYAVLQALVELFSGCVMTAFYYESRENTGVYAKLSTKEANA
jgi:hypothetical protein